MKKICPYCKKELVEGYINSGRFSFNWHNKNIGFIEKNTIFGGEILSTNTLIKCFRCTECNKIVIDLDNI